MMGDEPLQRGVLQNADMSMGDAMIVVRRGCHGHNQGTRRLYTTVFTWQKTLARQKEKKKKM